MKDYKMRIGKTCPACRIGVIEERKSYDDKWTHVIGCTHCPTEVRAKGATIIGVE